MDGPQVGNRRECLTAQQTSDDKQEGKRMTGQERTIGPIGTASRVGLGLIALYLAFVDGPPFAAGFSWGLHWYDAVLGLLVLPAITVGFGLLFRRYSEVGVRFTGEAGMALNCVVIVALILNPYTAGGALLFYGTMMLIAAARGQVGCEATVLSNWILRRDDQVGCPTFSPIDATEGRFRRSRSDASAAPLS